MSRFVLDKELDAIRIIEERRARRYERALIIALLILFALFILERLT